MKINETLKADLEKIVGDRIVTDPNELSMYAHDTGAMPSVMKLLVDMKPMAVVMPKSVDEVVELMKLAQKHRVPLTPRGAGSSGYGGAVPSKSGIVVDFSRMKRILNIDEEKKQVTVEPAVVWWTLQKELKKKNLMLKIYPTSALSATVAGWVAQGGSGIGSFEYGSISNHVVSAEIVTPRGDVKKVSGKELELVTDCEGITGFITSLIISVADYEEIVPMVAAFPKMKDMCAALNDGALMSLPFWSISFHTPEFVRLQQEANDKKVIPDGFSTIVFAMQKSRYEENKEKIENLIKVNNGELVGDEAAMEEWEMRFYPMRLKRLGPSVVPGEVVIPIKNVEAALAKVDGKIKARYFAIEGTMADKENFTVLSFALDDESRFAFLFAYGASLTLLKATKPFGGRAYTSGMYFGSEAPLLFGGNRYAKLMDYKKEIDPDWLINPGKILSPRIRLFPLIRLSTAMNLAEPFMRLLGGLTLYERPNQRIWAQKKVQKGSQNFKSELMEEFMWDIYSCAQCSFCKGCPFFNEKFIEAASPKGRLFFLKELVEGRAILDQNMANAFYYCSMCGYCNEVCQSKIPLMQLLERGKALAVESGLGPLPAHSKLKQFALETHNPYGQPLAACKELLPSSIPYKKSGEIVLFPGCTSSFKTKDLAINTAKIMKAGGVDFAYCEDDNWCCGSPFLRTGQTKVAEELILHNIKRMKEAGARVIVSPCPGCTMTIAHYWPEIAKKNGIEWNVEAKHVTVMIDELIKEGRLKFRKPAKKEEIKVTYHDPCHIGRHMKIYEEPRAVLKALPGVELVEMEHIKDEAQCCGAGGGVRSGLKDLADSLASKRMEEAQATGASAIVSSCPFCDMSFQVVNVNDKYGLTVRDVTDLVVERLEMPKEKEEKKSAKK